MALSQWDINQNVSGAYGVGVDQISPLGGDGSLFLDSTTPGLPGDRNVNIIPSDAGGITHGFTSGRIHSLINVASFNTGYQVGFVFLQSMDDVTTSGTGYYVAMRSLPSSSIDFRIQLFKFTSGVNSGVLLAQTGNSQSSLGTTFALEVDWNNLTGGQTRIDVNFKDSASDFIGLNLAFTYIDVSPITSSVGEGIVALNSTTGPEDFIARLDLTETFEIT